MDEDTDPHVGDELDKAEISKTLPDDLLEVIEAAFVCKTVKAKFLNENEFDLQIRIKIETNDTTPLFVNLLKKGQIQCKKSFGKVDKKLESCDNCSKNVPQTDGEMSLVFEVKDKCKCKDCLPVSGAVSSKELRSDKEMMMNKELTSLKDSDSKRQSLAPVSTVFSSKRVSGRKRRPPVKLRAGEECSVQLSGGNNDKAGDADDGDCDKEGVTRDKNRSSSRRTSKMSVTNTSQTVVEKHNVKTSVKEVTKDTKEIVVGPQFKQVTFKTKKSARSVRTKYECNVCGVSYSVKAAMVKHVKSHSVEEESTVDCDEVKNDSEINHRNSTRKKTVESECKEAEDSITTLTGDVSEPIDESDTKSENTEEEEVNNDTEEGSVPEKTVHSRRVSSVRPYKCSVCGRSYQLLKTLKSHERSHSEVFDYQCEICHKGFHLPSRLKYHMRLHTGERPYQCTICGSSFVKNGHLTHHMKTHNTDRPYKCAHCGKGFTEACYLKVHERNHTGEKPYQCDKCGKCFTNSSSFRFHQRVHNSEMFKCHVCDKTFQTEKSLQDHQGIHTGVRPFICDFCGKGCITLSRLNRHKRSHSLEKPHKCTQCDKAFHDQSDLRVHLKLHSGEKPFKCDVCNKRFALKLSLNRHSIVHSENRPYKCDECGKTYAVARQLKKHMMVHTGAKEFVCEQCGKCFLTSSSLRSHYQTHAGYRPHKCDICGRTYRSSWYLQVHRKTHTGENLIQCHTCGDWFINPSYFKLHQQKHCKGKLLYCTICNRGFSHNHALQSHMGLHTGERPFGCEICGKAFVKSALLQDHVKRHSEENVHKCSYCGKGFKRTNDRKKHELRHARKMRKLNLPDRLKPGHKDNTEQKDILQQATESIRDVQNGNGMDVECQEIDTPQVVTEQVVLTTIDSSQIADQSDNIQITSGKGVVQEQIVVSVDHPYFSGTDTPVVQIPHSSSVHIHTLTSDAIFHAASQAAVPVESSQLTSQHRVMVEPHRLQTLTAMQPSSVQLSSQSAVQPHSDQHLPVSIGQNPPLTHPMPAHTWTY